MKKQFATGLALLAASLLGIPAHAAEEADTTAARLDQLEQRQQVLLEELEALRKGAGSEAGRWYDRFTLGGYGEWHLNIEEGTAKDKIDLHRFVLYYGYRFADWIQLHSELEVEHARVHPSAGGYLLFEQAYLEFLLSDAFNIRMGRVLAPLGIVNQYHEPTTFNGVERPSVDKVIIPTTWSLDGIGAVGQFAGSMSYQIYLTGSMSPAGFTAKDGIREGRMHEQPGVGDPALSGRIEFAPADSGLRLGASFLTGGLDNGNGGSNPGIDGSVTILSADARASVSILDFRGVVAHTTLDGAEEINAAFEQTVAEEMMGWYVEAAAHLWPESFKSGKLAESDLVIFVRYDDYDTQYKMPDGMAKNKAYDRTELTAGLGFYPIPNIVVKADVQVRDDASDKDPADAFNMGVGWRF